MAMNRRQEKPLLMSETSKQEKIKQNHTDIIKVELHQKCDLVALKEAGKRLQKNIKTDKLDVQVKSIQIEGEALLIKIKPNHDNASRVFCEEIKTHLQKQGNAQLMVKMKTIIIRDIDNFTTEDEIAEAVRATLNLTTSVAVKKINKSGNRNQSMIVTLPELQAKLLLQTGKIVVGWVQCRVSEFLIPDKCFKCQRYGHKAEQCKSDKSDMKGKCLKCCTSGHIAKDCKATPKCYQCLEEGHSASSMNCSVYRKLVRVS